MPSIAYSVWGISSSICHFPGLGQYQGEDPSPVEEA